MLKESNNPGDTDMRYPIKNIRVATRTIDGEAVVVSSDDATLHSLNEVGTIIWEMADGSTSTEDMAQSLCNRFEVGLEQALNDIEEFCGELEKKKILNISEKPAQT